MCAAAGTGYNNSTSVLRPWRVLKRRRRLARAAKTLTRPNEQKPRWATRRGELLLEGTITVKCAAVKGSLDRLIGINSNGNVYPCSTAPLSSAIPLSSPALRSALSLSAQRVWSCSLIRTPSVGSPSSFTLPPCSFSSLHSSGALGSSHLLPGHMALRRLSPIERHRGAERSASSQTC